MSWDHTFTAFAGTRQIVAGAVDAMVRGAKAYLDEDGSETLLIFEDQTGRQVDFDFRGTPEDAVARLANHPLFQTPAAPEKNAAGPGRPRLGVVSREVTLLPRHWEWLEQQPAGISSTLRRLVDEARKQDTDRVDPRVIHERISRFMLSMAGNLPDFEEATRALYAGRYDQLRQYMQCWPDDIGAYVMRQLPEETQASS